MKDKMFFSINKINIMLFVISFILILFLKNIIVTFIYDLIITIMLIKKCKFSFFSIKIICINYPVLALFFQYYTNKSYGLLEITNINIQYTTILYTIIFYDLIWLFIFYFTNILNLEKKKIEGNKYILNDYFSVFLCFIAILSSIIAFPRLPFIKVLSINDRFNSLFGGNAWNHVTVVCLLFLFNNIKKQKIVKFTYFFCIFWFLSHYERVDIIGLLLGILIIIFIKKKLSKKIKIKDIIKFAIPMFLIAIIFTFVGDSRQNFNKNNNGTSIINKLLIQSTSADEAYIYNIAIDYSNKNGDLLFKPYLNYIYGAFFGADYNENITSILKANYPHPGGEFLLSAPYMSFNYFGIIVFSILEFIILYYILIKKRIIFNYWYLLILCTSYRITWYGITYIETAMFYIIPVFLLISKIFKKGIYIKEEKNEK